MRLAKRLAAWTNRAAGRAWSPDGSMTVSRRSGRSSPQARGSLVIVAAPSAAAATSSIEAPMLAWTAARIAPSTSGASLMRTRARSAASNSSRASSRLSAALPRSSRTSASSAPRVERRPDRRRDPRGAGARGVRPRSRRPWPPGRRRRRPGRPCRAGPRRACRCGRSGPGPPIAPPFVAPGCRCGDGPPEVIKKPSKTAARGAMKGRGAVAERHPDPLPPGDAPPRLGRP